jgi:hypothetical protein
MPTEAATTTVTVTIVLDWKDRLRALFGWRIYLLVAIEHQVDVESPPPVKPATRTQLWMAHPWRRNRPVTTGMLAPR